MYLSTHLCVLDVFELLLKFFQVCYVLWCMPLAFFVGNTDPIYLNIPKFRVLCQLLVFSSLCPAGGKFGRALNQKRANLETSQLIHEGSLCYHITGPWEKYIQVDMIFNYSFGRGLRGNLFPTCGCSSLNLTQMLLTLHKWTPSQIIQVDRILNCMCSLGLRRTHPCRSSKTLSWRLDCANSVGIYHPSVSTLSSKTTTTHMNAYQISWTTEFQVPFV